MHQFNLICKYKLMGLYINTDIYIHIIEVNSSLFAIFQIYYICQLPTTKVSGNLEVKQRPTRLPPYKCFNKVESICERSLYNL